MTYLSECRHLFAALRGDPTQSPTLFKNWVAMARSIQAMDEFAKDNPDASTLPLTVILAPPAKEP